MTADVEILGELRQTQSEAGAGRPHLRAGVGEALRKPRASAAVDGRPPAAG